MNNIVQKAIYQLFNKEPFFALMLQELNIRTDFSIPTMCVYFEKKIGKFFMHINTDFFNQFTDEQKQGLLIHELLHILHKHIFDLRQIEGADKKVQNLAMDMAINQYIQNLPEECVDVNKWTTKDGKPFPKYAHYETYYKLIEESKNNKSKEIFDKFNGKGTTIDEHDFESLSEEEKKELLKELKNVINRTREKSVYSHTTVPKEIKDLLEQLDTIIDHINYKKILLNTIKKSLSALDRQLTWNKPNKRFGYFAKGTKPAEIPKAYFFIDTSGSISHTEINEFLSVVDGFLAVGQKKCHLGKWHTSLYDVKKYRKGNKLKESDIQAGGTDPKPVLDFIKKKNPDLSIILTDGYFDAQDKKQNNNILWVISKDGNQDKAFLNRLPGKWVKMT